MPDNEGSWLRDFEIGIWLDRVEGICLRAGNLKRRLDKDNERVIRMLSTLEQDGTLLEIRNLWKLEPGEDSKDPHLEEGLGARHPINEPNTTPRQMDATLSVPGPKKQVSCAPDGWRGARHPINTPNSTPQQQGGRHQHAGGQDGRKVQHQHAGKQNTSGGGPSDWSVHMTGLIGWWRRVEHTQNKQEEKQRKLIENQKKMSVAKLSFVSRYFPTMTTRKQEMTSPNPAICMKTRIKKSVILSPATKRKGWGVEHSAEFYSPSKKIKTFKSKLEYWENMTKTESGYLAEPCDETMVIKERDNRCGGSGGGVGGI